MHRPDIIRQNERSSGDTSHTNRHTGTTCEILSRVNNKRHTPHKKMADRIRQNERSERGGTAERKKEIDTSTSRDEEISKEGDDGDKHIAKMHNAGGAETL